MKKVILITYDVKVKKKLIVQASFIVRRLFFECLIVTVKKDFEYQVADIIRAK